MSVQENPNSKPKLFTQCVDIGDGKRVCISVALEEVTYCSGCPDCPPDKREHSPDCAWGKIERNIGDLNPPTMSQQGCEDKNKPKCPPLPDQQCTPPPPAQQQCPPPPPEQKQCPPPPPEQKQCPPPPAAQCPPPPAAQCPPPPPPPQQQCPPPPPQQQCPPPPPPPQQQCPPPPQQKSCPPAEERKECNKPPEDPCAKKK